MNKIYYFTGTGNSLYIARTIISGTKNAKMMASEELIDIASIVNHNKSIQISGEKIGFVFPVYFARTPVIVKKFMELVTKVEADYVFAVMNGGGLFGSALLDFSRKLKQVGVELDAGFLMKMPSNHPKIAELQKKSNDEILKDAKIKLEDIASCINAKRKIDLKVSPPILGSLITRFAFGKVYQQSVNGILDNVFDITEECDHCGKCIISCPMKNIGLEEGKVTWMNHCANCGRCYHICPVKAIQFGKDDMDRYINPYIDVNDFMA